MMMTMMMMMAVVVMMMMMSVGYLWVMLADVIGNNCELFQQYSLH